MSNNLCCLFPNEKHHSNIQIPILGVLQRHQYMSAYADTHFQVNLKFVKKDICL